jgi:hypothetical protein
VVEAAPCTCSNELKQKTTRMDKDKIEYTMIDCEGLATVLAENDWKIETKNIHVSDLYETHVVADLHGNVEVKKEVRGFWASQFMNLRSAYVALIEQFSKPKEHAVSQEEGTTDSTGSDSQDR